MQWYYQTSPHDTHDWDSAQTPVLVDAPFNGRMRKLVLTAARNGYYFTLDRVTGEHLVTGKFSDTANWAKRMNEKGQPVRDPKKDHDIAGALVSVGQRRRGQLAAADLQPGHRVVLRAARGIVGDVLPRRNRSARRDGARRQGRDRARRRDVSWPPSITRPARLSGSRSIRASRAAEAAWASVDRRAAAVRRGRRRQLRGARRGERQAALAHADRQPLERARKPTCSTAINM